jgi:hypothetical protein
MFLRVTLPNASLIIAMVLALSVELNADASCALAIVAIELIDNIAKLKTWMMFISLLLPL